MRCTSPRTVGFKADGQTLCWSPKDFSNEYATFQLPCSKCLECRLEYSRQWAIRCVHEAQMHEKNVFITLTYEDEKLISPKLVYSDFQKFMKKLRKVQNEPIGLFVTGEYGEKNKRPHWHAIIFNWHPTDGVYKYSNHRGDRVYSSETLSKLWGNGVADYGSVTLQSAGYCARYAAKKLVHGKDDEHDYHPISKKSSKHAIGKKWIEKFHADVFSYGKLELPDGTSTTIPRYYEKWYEKHHPEKYWAYVSNIKNVRAEEAQRRAAEENRRFFEVLHERNREKIVTTPLTQRQIKKIIKEQQFKELQDNLKL